jgi:ATP phosphoribosyltransferase
MSAIKFAIPSKGRLRDLTIDWFIKRKIQIELAVGQREYSARMVGFPEIEIILLSSGEIPIELAAGRVDLGITGQDLVREKIPFWTEAILELKLLNYGYANLVLAVPKFWVDVETLDDFDAVATNFRRENGYRLRIATKYQNLIWAYMQKMGVADYQLIDSQGATEGVIKNNAAEAIADITSSGETLTANHLKIIGLEPVLRSQATLYLSSTTTWDNKKYKNLISLCNKISVKPPKIGANGPQA